MKEREIGFQMKESNNVLPSDLPFWSSYWGLSPRKEESAEFRAETACWPSLPAWVAFWGSNEICILLGELLMLCDSLRAL